MYSRTKQLLAILLFNVALVNAQNGAHTVISSGPCNPIIPLLCPSGVLNASNAADNDLSTYATMVTAIGIGSASYLQLGFDNPAPGGYTVAIFTDESTVLDVDVLAAVSLTLYDANGMQVKNKVGFDLADVQIDDQQRGIIRVKVPKNKTASSVKITIGGLLLLDNNVNIYGAVYAPNNTPVYADGVYAEGPCDPIVPIVCPGGVLNSGNAVDGDPNNFATLTIPIGVGGDAYLDLSFSQPGPEGFSVFFTLGTDALILDATLLENLKLNVYDENGNVVKEKNGFALADVTVLGGNQFRIHVKTKMNGTYKIARARITLNSLVSVLTDVEVFNAYYKGKVDFASYFRFSDQGAAADLSDLEVYPNPASHMVNVDYESDNTEQSTYQIMNVVGDIVAVGKMNSDMINTIDISHLSNGVYNLRVNDNGTLLDKKILIQQ